MLIIHSPSLLPAPGLISEADDEYTSSATRTSLSQLKLSLQKLKKQLMR